MLCELLGGVPVQLVLGWAELWLSMATMFMSGILVMLTSTTWGTWNTWNILHKNKRWYCFRIYLFTLSSKKGFRIFLELSRKFCLARENCYNSANFKDNLNFFFSTWSLISPFNCFMFKKGFMCPKLCSKKLKRRLNCTEVKTQP